MAPNHNFVLTDASGEPVSRTYQYRKVMKPMLERKRRARINRCLDELKELMTSALQTEGENVAKLEKADILELTVRHLHNLRHQNVLGTRAENSYAEKFKAGFRHCAAEVSNFLGVVDQDTSAQVVKHLNTCINHMERSSASNVSQFPYQPHQVHPAARPSIQIQSPNQINAQATSSRNGWSSKLESPPSPQQQQQYYADKQKYQMMMQRPLKKQMLYEYQCRSANSTPESLNEYPTRINTPPISPNIDIDDSSVWRPW